MRTIQDRSQANHEDDLVSVDREIVRSSKKKDKKDQTLKDLESRSYLDPKLNAKGGN